jgi:uncharacterized protein
MGGEATLNPKLVSSLHRYARQLATQHGLELEGVVLSNGVNLTPDFIESLRELELALMISLDGIGDFHDRQRPLVNGGGSFTSYPRK